jgi:hypothetical protein
VVKRLLEYLLLSVSFVEDSSIPQNIGEYLLGWMCNLARVFAIAALKTIGND